MSLFSVVWRKYGLKSNPYFIEPLTVNENNIPISAFIGRQKEIEVLTSMINMGSGRFLVIGDAGVGKTSLVNFVRAKAMEGQFFTPRDEIEINNAMTAQEFIIETLSPVYRELNRQSILLSGQIMGALENLYEFGKLNEKVEMSYDKLRGLFRDVMKEVAHPRFKGIILHYDNLDNIKERDDITKMMGEIRDLFFTQNVIFFFVGGRFLPEDIGYDRRVRQAFNMPPLEVPELSFDDVKKILDERIKHLTLYDNVPPTMPHTEESLKLLFAIHKGNLRDILNSLSSCIMEIARTNSPVQVDEVLLRRTLLKKIERDCLLSLTHVEKEILQTMLGYGKPITPTELALLTKKRLQNITSKYLPRLQKKTAVEFIGQEGRKKFFRVSPEINWLRLQTKNKEREAKKTLEAKDFVDKKLSEFMY